MNGWRLLKANLVVERLYHFLKFGIGSSNFFLHLRRSERRLNDKKFNPVDGRISIHYRIEQFIEFLLSECESLLLRHKQLNVHERLIARAFLDFLRLLL